LSRNGFRHGRIQSPLVVFGCLTDTRRTPKPSFRRAATAAVTTSRIPSRRRPASQFPVTTTGSQRRCRRHQPPTASESADHFRVREDRAIWRASGRTDVSDRIPCGPTDLASHRRSLARVVSRRFADRATRRGPTVIGRRLSTIIKPGGTVPARGRTWDPGRTTCRDTRAGSISVTEVLCTGHVKSAGPHTSYSVTVAPAAGPP
jgi:hypothetical protein